MDQTVLLVMDVQRGVVERFAEDRGYLERLSQAITAARGAGIPVVYVIVGFRPGHPEISARNRTFSAAAAAGQFVEGSPATEIHPAIAPAPGDLVVTKRRWPGRWPRPAWTARSTGGCGWRRWMGSCLTCRTRRLTGPRSAGRWTPKVSQRGSPRPGW